MAEEEGTAGVSLFKKRTNSAKIRSSASSTSLRSLAPDSPAKSGSIQTDNDDDNDDEGNVPIIRRKKTPAAKVKDRESKPKSRLSFGQAQNDDDEQEEETVTIKRTDSPARKLLNTLTHSSSNSSLRPPASLDQATISHSASSSTSTSKSIYSKEYLDQLKSSTLSTPPPSSRDRDSYDDLTRSKFGSAIDDASSNIPTTAAIASAREKRERMRLQGISNEGAQDGFVSLEVGFASKGGESRLVREEDEIGDGDEDMAEFTESQTTIPLGRKANKEAAQRLRSGMVDMIQDAQEEDEGDEEAREWELAQIRRGEQRRDAGRGSSNKASKKPYRAAPIPSSSTLPSLSGVSSRLTSALTSLKSDHLQDSSALDHFAREREELDAQEKELREEVQKAEQRNRWFAEFKGFIEEVAAFLDEKHALLEKIEKSNFSIQKERYEIVGKRRFADDSDDVALFTGATVSPVFVLKPPGQEEEDEEEETTAPETDEFGRVKPDEKAPRSAVREERRESRRRRSASKLGNSGGAGGDGTDDELDVGDSQDLAAALSSLREDLVGVFSDVKADDFRDPNLGIRRKFEEWRAKFAEDYQNAFGGLALVGVWEFWARVEMAMWNPFGIAQLVKTPPGLDSYKWHENLSSYGHAAQSSANNPVGEGEEDESETVVNGLVSSVIIPRLEKLARETYDPLSRNQTAKALGLIDEVSYCVERSSPKFESLILAFLSRFQLAITQAQTLIAPHLATISLPKNSFDPSTFEARNRFANRHVKLVTNALRWRRWGRSLRLHSGGNLVGAGGTFDELITRELVAKVLLPVLEASWGTGGAEIAQTLLSILPTDDTVPPALRRRLEGSS
ncbi:hypothetical protein T439DRAFT_342265 [Meredithblackwellia eburnea MCA 4105]